MHLLFDSIIFGFLVLDGVLVGLLIFRIRKWKRHHKAVPFSAKSVLVLGLLAWAVIFYGSFIEPKLIVINEQKIFLSNPGGAVETAAALQKTTVRIALVSDLHLGIYKKTAFAEKVAGAVNALEPDIIVLAGDFLYGEEGEEADPEYLTPLKNLRSKYGSFAVLGNHDYEENFEDEPNFSYEGNKRVQNVVRVLSDTGVKVLRNESVQIKMEGRNAFVLGGVDEVWTGRADVTTTFKNYSVESKPGIGPKILIAHNPDIIHDAEKAGIDLVLSAHTHGGQIRLPFFGPVPEIPTELGQKYDRGLFSFGKTQLFITSGVGESGPRARLFVPPEIALVEMDF